MNKNFLIIFVFILFTNNSLACDALKLTGTKVSSAKETFFIIDGYSEEDFDEDDEEDILWKNVPTP